MLTTYSFCCEVDSLRWTLNNTRSNDIYNRTAKTLSQICKQHAALLDDKVDELPEYYKKLIRAYL